MKKEENAIEALSNSLKLCRLPAKIVIRNLGSGPTCSAYVLVGCETYLSGPSIAATLNCNCVIALLL